MNEFTEYPASSSPLEHAGDGTTRLLVSVRSAAEARIALRGGASFIDIKEPAKGSLGRASRNVHVEVVETMRSEMAADPELQRPIVMTAALGELVDSEPPSSYCAVEGLSLYKLGLSRCDDRSNWTQKLDAWRDHLASAGAELAAVAYADHAAARSPAPRRVLDYAIDRRVAFLLIDTFEKIGQTLTDFLDEIDLRRLLDDAQGHGVSVALAGSLRLEDLTALAELGTDVVAVRGAACKDGRRDQDLDADRIRELAAILKTSARVSP